MTENTPAGGDRSDIIYLDPNGNLLPSKDGAVQAIVREFRNGILIRRSYMSLTHPDQLPTWTPSGDVAAEPAAADTAKNTWDVWAAENGTFRLATTVVSLLEATGHDGEPVAQQRVFLLKLMSLPSWQAAPAELKQDVTHWLARH